MLPLKSADYWFFSTKFGKAARRTQNCAAFVCKFVVLLCALNPAYADQAKLEIIALEHRSAGELLPVIKPLLQADESVSALDSRLIIRAQTATLRDIHALLDQLDRPLRRLLLTVQYVSAAAANHDETRINAEMNATEDSANAGARVRVLSTRSRADGDLQQQVQVIEGGEAFIDVGKLLPYNNYRIETDRGDLSFEQRIEYLKTGSGFYARPRLNGEHVTVEISPRQSSAQAHTSPPVLDTQALTTTVSGKLGEWILLGASTSADNNDQSGLITRSAKTHGQEDKRLRLRVTALE